MKFSTQQKSTVTCENVTYDNNTGWDVRRYSCKFMKNNYFDEY